MSFVKANIQQQLIEVLESVIPSSIPRPISLHEPVFFGNELKYVTECITTGWVSSVGKYVDLIEQQLCEFTGAKYAVAVVNGTAALHLGYLMAGVQQGDEVLMPALTFIATANAATYCGAVPHFVDSDENDLGICPVKIEKYLEEIADLRNGVCVNKKTGRIIRALCVTHIFGLPAQLKPLKVICDMYKIAMIEDAAEALGSYYKGQHVGHYGCCGILSFNGNKITTTGGGGALLTDDEEIAKRAKHLSTTAKIPAESWEYRYDAIGYNYRMPNINAALGCAQLENLPTMLEKKRLLAKKYKNQIECIEGLTFISESENTSSNYWLNAVRCDFESGLQRDAFLKALITHGFGCRPIWALLTTHKPYQNNPKMILNTSIGLERNVLNLPSGVAISG